MTTSHPAVIASFENMATLVVDNKNISHCRSVLLPRCSLSRTKDEAEKGLLGCSYSAFWHTVEWILVTLLLNCPTQFRNNHILSSIDKFVGISKFDAWVFVPDTEVPDVLALFRASTRARGWYGELADEPQTEGQPRTIYIASKSAR
jgi:hypothetical protein